ncbi:curli assembly protein CsgF [uncultured Draconibacterium sp.]|uniref:curli production assembly/transport component CsgF n=1 Tax=uncultured Draconibacterium sp. TaxID=1573823 RepID=UPI0029C6326D|nr:curli assembly protein CsgF [uncultured Draconibacterium sp.]
MKKTLFVLPIFLILISLSSSAQDFVYSPKNPAFGGNPYNYSWMLSSAEAQNTIEAPSDGVDAYSRYGSDPASDFAESLNRQILSRLSREIVTKQFGEDALEEGSYVLGDYQIDIGDAGSGVNITISDNSTGATTTVEVPYF